MKKGRAGASTWPMSSLHKIVNKRVFFQKQKNSSWTWAQVRIYTPQRRDGGMVVVQIIDYIVIDLQVQKEGRVFVHSRCRRLWP